MSGELIAITAGGMPEILFEIGDIAVSRRMGMIGVFIILMFLASYFILNEKVYKKEKTDKKTNYFLIIFEGLIVGAVTGFVGAGGGFLIVPAFAHKGTEYFEGLD